MIEQFLRWLMCAINNHRYNVVRQMNRRCQKLECLRCGKTFAINHELKIIVPWDDNFERFYDRTRK